MGGVHRLRGHAPRLRAHRRLLLVEGAEEQRGVPHGRKVHGHLANGLESFSQVMTIEQSNQIDAFSRQSLQIIMLLMAAVLFITCLSKDLDRVIMAKNIVGSHSRASVCTKKFSSYFSASFPPSPCWACLPRSTCTGQCTASSSFPCPFKCGMLSIKLVVNLGTFRLLWFLNGCYLSTTIWASVRAMKYIKINILSRFMRSV